MAFAGSYISDPSNTVNVSTAGEGCSHPPSPNQEAEIKNDGMFWVGGGSRGHLVTTAML